MPSHGEAIAEAWAKFPQAAALERRATELIDEALSEVTGETEQLVDDEPVDATGREEFAEENDDNS